MSVIISAEQINKHFDDLHVLKDVSLDVHEGEVICIIGPSGSGKSTFLRCINQLEVTTDGIIRVMGEIVGYREDGDKLHRLSDRKIAAQRSRVGMVFQRFNLFPHKTVLENILEGPVFVQKRNKEQVKKEALEILKKVGLSNKANSYPNSLSGGQQQRVAIARTLAMKPDAILFDEPTSALDPELVGEVLAVMKELANSGMTMIVVTHEIGFCREVADKVVFMESGEIVAVESPENMLTNPTHARLKEFVSAVL
ncbi:amino acid ABC transporter ATP-binding protein [Marinomonas sp. C2222]|uniref:Amino acid ABC transporter ATP-binding protein n=1 Tax=Marinomonas sargassi TaxID=2984494 RepID=A0ABT2YUP1_9GAMM|nr:amino acid ABC transporter ATP-binding protein [Marinomonas sargassi]MCV2403578.1 amino acid ABC transporter ATP-binding protein [Marinomonas sargassi]